MYMCVHVYACARSHMCMYRYVTYVPYVACTHTRSLTLKHPYIYSKYTGNIYSKDIYVDLRKFINCILWFSPFQSLSFHMADPYTVAFYQL